MQLCLAMGKLDIKKNEVFLLITIEVVSLHQQTTCLHVYDKVNC